MENVKDFWSRVEEVLDLTLIDTTGVVLTVGQVLLAVLALISGLLVVRIIECLVAGRMKHSNAGPDMMQLVRPVEFRCGFGPARNVSGKVFRWHLVHIILACGLSIQEGRQKP